jgi:electron transfer flavoprotein alpha subunit
LGRAALEALAQAPAGFDLGVVGEGAAEAARQVGGCGAARVLIVSGAEFAASRYATDAAAAAAVVQASGAAIVLAPCTARWHRALPGVAERLNGAVDTHVSSFSAGSVTRWFYRQRIEGTLRREKRPWFVLLDGGSAAPGVFSAADVVAEEVPVAAVTVRTEVVGIEKSSEGQETIRPDAETLLVAGAGWTKKQKDGAAHADVAATLILDFLAKARASLGSSKSLVDLSGEGQAVLPFLSHLHQIGQTGATPRHVKGLATCCHGEEPHVVGWRFINERRAVNLDPNCGWARGKADVLYVADAFEVMKELNALLG